MVSNIIEVPSIAVDLDSTTSSVALGDALTGDTATIEINGTSGKGELHVKDDDLLAEVVDLNAKDFATETTLALAKDELVDINSKIPSGLTVIVDELKVAATVKSSLINVPHDEVVLTYVGATTDIATVVAKLASVTVVTLTFTYDGSNRLVGVVRT